MKLDKLELGRSPHPNSLSPVNKPFFEKIQARLEKVTPKACKLLPFQQVGVTFGAATRMRFLLADDMGLGKTVQAISCLALKREQSLPALLVVPGVVLTAWQETLNSWLPGVRIGVLQSLRDAMPAAGWSGCLLVPWSIVSQHAEALAGWGFKTLIVDEAHKGVNQKTTQGGAIQKLAKAISQRIIITGTPVMNKLRELHALMDLVHPGKYGTREEFMRTYRKDPDALQLELQQIMVRRLHTEVDTGVPPKIRHTLSVRLSKRYQQEYEKAEKEFLVWVKEKLRSKIEKQLIKEGVKPKHLEKRVQRELRKRISKLELQEALTKINHLRRISGYGKIRPAARWLAEVAPREPVVVFAEHRKVLLGLQGELKKRNIEARLVFGATSRDEKDDAIRDFQMGKFPVLLLSLKSASVGVTLTHARNTLFVERHWNPALEDQAEDRTHRITQDSVTHQWYMSAKGVSVDQRMNQVLSKKRGLINETVGSAEIERNNKIRLLSSYEKRMPKHTMRDPKSSSVRVELFPGQQPLRRTQMIAAEFPVEWEESQAQSWLARHSLKPGTMSLWRGKRLCLWRQVDPGDEIENRMLDGVKVIYRAAGKK